MSIVSAPDSVRDGRFKFLESSLERRLISQYTWMSPVSNDERLNFYRWKFSETFPRFSKTPFSQWLSANYFELNNALDTGALTVVPIFEHRAPQKILSTRNYRPKVQALISRIPLSAVIRFYENGMQKLASENAQCSEPPARIIPGKSHEEHGTSHLKLLCNQPSMEPPR
ncbi:uncharacterized protein EAF01_007696 [Botrytis porri]|uniref:Uncharacterized protein n=1 Tax=Botrytis porri TaxID=87229 RepID=A0A4Z1KPJ0_9HELO|nr:uncharacterized protein EAF01_007696 [Botrytis porri]KAF7900394.1 hypothetical protein EAF01_007696 [Botrytis porri]TGO85634.1 hypothetical protein BPOR_0377g00030 [Botrytis porri]